MPLHVVHPEAHPEAHLVDPVVHLQAACKVHQFLMQPDSTSAPVHSSRTQDLYLHLNKDLHLHPNKDHSQHRHQVNSYPTVLRSSLGLGDDQINRREKEAETTMPQHLDKEAERTTTLQQRANTRRMTAQQHRLRMLAGVHHRRHHRRNPLIRGTKLTRPLLQP